MTKWISLLFSVALFVFVLELSRRDKLTFKYAAGWFLLSLLGILASIFNRYLFIISDFFGFYLLSNFIFFILLCFFIFLSLFLTVFLCQQNKRNDLLAQALARLESHVQEITKRGQ